MRERDIYSSIYVCKGVEGLVQTSLILSLALFPDRSGITCVVYHAGAGRFGVLTYNCFRCGYIRIFTRLI